MKELRFSLNIVPPKTTSQQKGVFVANGKPRFFTKSRNKRDIDALLAMLTPHRPPVPFEGPLQVSVEWHFPYRKQEKKSVVRAGVPIPNDKRPDLDNLEKSFFDAMTRLYFWHDDGQIAWKQTRKLWSARPRIDVYIFAMSECVAIRLAQEEQAAKEAGGGSMSDAPRVPCTDCGQRIMTATRYYFDDDGPMCKDCYERRWADGQMGVVISVEANTTREVQGE